MRHPGGEAWGSWRLGCGQKSAASTSSAPQPKPEASSLPWSFFPGKRGLHSPLTAFGPPWWSLDDPNGAYDVP